MSNKARSFGLSNELQKKKDAKFDPALAGEVMDWIKAMLELGDGGQYLEKIKGSSTQCEVRDSLKDGQILCHIMNMIRGNEHKIKINTGTMTFKQMENVNNFLSGAEALGCTKTDLFQTVDLTEGNNIPSVIDGISAVGRKVSKLDHCDDFPTLGPEEADANKREFTKEQLEEGKNVIGLQMGSNKGASQAGQNFGKTRSIID